MIKKLFFSLSAAFILIVITILFTPISLFQNEILNYLNNNKDFQISIEGPIDYRLISAGDFSAKEVSIITPTYEIVLDEVDLSFDIGSLLKKDIVIKKLNLNFDSITEVKNSSAKKESAKKGSKGINSITIEDINIKVEVLDILTHRLQNMSLSSKKIIANLNSNLIDGEINFSLFQKSISGKIIAKGKEFQGIEVILKLLNIDEVLSRFKIMGANIHGDLGVKYSGEFKEYSDPLNNRMNIEISGSNLKWIGKDLDKILDAYIDSKKVGLLDAAGYLTLGPLGILVAKGADLGNAGVRGIIKGETLIEEVNFDLAIDDNMISLDDVAVRTKEYRIAAKGEINLNEKKYQNLVLATVDERGCSIFRQKISGKLSSPEIGALGSFVNEVFSPITDIINKGLSLVTSNCDVFYDGKVKK